MDEAGALEVAPEVHLHADAPARKTHHEQRLQHDDRPVNPCEKSQPARGAGLDKMVDGVLLELRQQDIHRRAAQVQQKNRQQHAPVRFQVGEKALPDFQAERGGVFLFLIPHRGLPPLSAARGRRRSSESHKFSCRCRPGGPALHAFRAPRLSRGPAPESGRPASAS